jgi:hypothetical protein
MTALSASTPQPTTFQDYQKMIDRAKADCGVTPAEREIEELAVKKDTIDHLLTLPRKERRKESEIYDLRKTLDIDINESQKINGLFMPMANLYVFGMGGLLMGLDKLGLVSQAAGMPMVCAFIASCFAMPPILSRILDRVIAPRRVDKALVNQLKADRVKVDQELSKSQVRKGEAMERFNKWRRDNDIVSWVEGRDNGGAVTVDEEYVDIDGLKVKMNRNLSTLALIA